MNQIIITGASGMLGGLLCKHFAQQGTQVFGIGRNTSNIPNHELIVKCRADIVVFDELYNINLPRNCPIIHTAAKVSFHKKDALEIKQVNVKGTRNIVNLALHLESSKFIHLSSSSAIGKAKEGLSTINTERNEDDFTRYGLSKYESEMEVMRGNAEGLKTAILNPGIFICPYSKSNAASALIDLVLRNNAYSTQASTLYTDVRDIISAIDLLLKQEEMPFEQAIIGNFHASNHEIQQAFAKILGKNGPYKNASKGLLKLLNKLQWIGELFGFGQVLITSEIIKQSQSSQVFDKDSITRLLPGFQYHKKEDSIQYALEPLLGNS